MTFWIYTFGITLGVVIAILLDYVFDIFKDNDHVD